MSWFGFLSALGLVCDTFIPLANFKIPCSTVLSKGLSKPYPQYMWAEHGESKLSEDLYYLGHYPILAGQAGLKGWTKKIDIFLKKNCHQAPKCKLDINSPLDELGTINARINKVGDENLTFLLGDSVERLLGNHLLFKRRLFDVNEKFYLLTHQY